MTELAKIVTIDRATKRVLIDGVEFPFYLAEGGPQVEDPLNPNAMAVVHLPLIADDIEILPAENGPVITSERGPEADVPAGRPHRSSD